MSATEKPSGDADESDFDNSDEDLASLLGDDDDDIFAKKIYGNSPAKISIPEAPQSAKVKQTKTISPSLSFEKSSEVAAKPAEVRQSSKDEFELEGDDILDSFLGSNSGKIPSFKSSSPLRNNLKRDSFQTDENGFFDDLDISSVSPSKDKLNKKSPIKKAKSIDKQSEILDDASETEKNSSKGREGRRGSFFDDFLQKLSPKHEIKKSTKSIIPEENTKDNDENEEDILSAYIPTAPKKYEVPSDAVPKSPKRRTSLIKQVSFKDLPDDFPDSDIAPITSATTSPLKETISKPLLRSKKKEQDQKSGKIDSSKEEDIDWENFFKDSPTKSSKVPETKKKDIEQKEKQMVTAGKPKSAIRRQSSADWLGLSDSRNPDEDAVDDNFIDVSIVNTNPIRPRSANAPIIRSRRQELSKKASDWNDENDFIKSLSQPAATDLPQLQNDTNELLKENKSASSTPLLRDFTKSDIFSSQNKDLLPKQQLNDNASFSNSVFQDTIKNAKNSNPETSFVSPNVHQSYEQTATLHSLQLMLDDSIKERNRLLKENENTKVLLEENIKALEEFHKSEKKLLEDSIKTLESSLKKEFEVRSKSLEEQLNLITAEKEKQSQHFEEKLDSIRKEHQQEIQRLKDLHNQSINLMKKDHEEALSRLKKLKEQEVEAVLSTQMHSKSLEYLNDQLQARASELASLENKVEERNQATLREKQALLDSKEKNLKALQNRLQKQLDDSEEERTRLQQLLLRLENRLQKITAEGEEDHWETQQMKTKLAIQQKYMEEEQKLNQYQLEKEKEKLRISQDSLLHEQKTILLQLAQERQQLTQEKIGLQSLSKSIKEEEAKLNIKKLKVESSIETEKQFLLEEKNKFHFEKERIKEECFQLERQRDSLQREKQQLKSEKEELKELEISLKRKAAEIEEIAAIARQEQERGRREHSEAISIQKDQELKTQQYTQQMQKLMEKERQILLEREMLMEEKVEFEKTKNAVLCTRCKLSIESPIETPPANMPVVFPLSSNGLLNPVQQSFVDPRLVIWHVTAQKDREFLQEELAFLKSLKETNRKKNSK